MSSDKGMQAFVDTRLDTWKSIAQYLGRSSRTVQRWHSEYELPVRHLGGDASSVFAYTDELDRWLRARDRSVSGNHLHSEPVVEPFSPAQELKRLQPVGSREQEQTPANEHEAAELITKAQKLWESMSANNLNIIARHYRRAIDLDASNAQGFAGLSQTLVAQALLGNLHPSAALRASEAALERALEIDPELFEAQCASALLKILLKRDWSGARKSLDAAMIHRPGSTLALVGRAFFAIAQNSLSEATGLLRRASIERPLNSSVAELLCWVEYLDGNPQSALALIVDARETGHGGGIIETVEALCNVLIAGPASQIQRLESVTASSPRNYALFGVLGYAYGKVGEIEAARQIIESMAHTGLNGVHDFAYPIALTWLGIGNRREAAMWLRQSYEHGSLWSLGFPADPMLAGLRADLECNELFGHNCYPVADLHIETRGIMPMSEARASFSA